jgi:hypothetical protein
MPKMNMGTKSRIVVVTGDVTLDWNLARARDPGVQSFSSETEGCSRLKWQRGEAALLADLIEAVAAQIADDSPYDIRQVSAPRRTGNPTADSIGPEDPRFHHSYRLWLPFPYSTLKGFEKEKAAWRVASFLGLNRCSGAVSEECHAKVVGDSTDAELVVLDDANLSFRSNRDLWPASLTTAGCHPFVLLKLSCPIAQGSLWECLSERHAERLTVVMKADDLRLSEVHISRELSWERTAQDLAWEVLYSRGLAGLARCAHVVISFGAAGAFVYTRGNGEWPCRLLFDPEAVEGTWEQCYPGRMVGSTSCLVAGIARELMLAPDAPDISRGARAGLASARFLHREGYGRRGTAASEVELEFPVRAVAEATNTNESPFQETPVSMRSGAKYWTILGDRHRDDLEELARQVVLKGPERVLKGVPLGCFGALLTVDRQEIESLRSIRSVVGEYVSQARPKRPLSIAVFGPPGSGKSFGITQLALALRPGEIEPKEFNLSQFASPGELLSALHQVRDIALGGKIPLVFWDEFDSDFQGPYGWLRYFLAPMQDGRFQEGDVSHPVGKAIFVFAGGTSETLENFGRNATPDQARSAKVPDFVSRLKGYMNVLGPNPRAGTEDPYFVLRRAILLRSMLSRDAKHVLRGGEMQIDAGVLRAMLWTRVYNHGARSMESVIAMSRLAGESRFERSCLPTEAQLDLHVDGQDFLARVHQLEIDAEILDRLARAAHAVYCAEQTGNGFKYGPRRNAAGKNNPLVDFDILPEDEKEQNRSQVRDIPSKLAHAGCYMVPARSGEPPFEFPSDVLEELASMEHARWVREKLKSGWRYGADTDQARRFHNCLLPWLAGDVAPDSEFSERIGRDALPEAEKEKDRAAVRKITTILAQAGYTIVEARSRRRCAGAAAKSEQQAVRH